MKATYQEYTIEAVKRDDGLYHALINGQESGVTSHYKVTTIKRAMAAIDEQEQTKLFAVLKEAGL
jgi:hypothetical protein